MSVAFDNYGDDDAKYYFDWAAHNAAKPLPFWNDERIATLTEMWGASCRAEAIGLVIGCTKMAVIGKANRLGLPPHKRPFRDFKHRRGSRKSKRTTCVS